VIRLFMYSAHYRNLVNYSLDSLADATRRAIYLYDAIDRIRETLTRGGVAPEVAPTGPAMAEHQAVVGGFTERFEQALADDFNVPMAMTHVLELARLANEITSNKKRPKPEALVTLHQIAGQLRAAGEVLMILTMEPAAALITLRDMCARTMELDTAWVEGQIAARQQARAAKDWAAADIIRHALLERSVEIMDGAEGTTWRIRIEAPTQ
jgi:cysteinyl-tRNA synthetase